MDTSAGKICVVRCIHEEDRKAWIQMSKKTHTNPLSKQEIEKLRKNPYVASVTANTVRFTEAFKELAYEKKDASFVQSMSRKGNCWDNAPQESFFGHMKDEIASLIAGCATYEQVQSVVADWMDYYNKDRYQWDLEKLSPREYYCYRQTGVYPLKPGISKTRNSRGSAPDPEV